MSIIHKCSICNGAGVVTEELTIRVFYTLTDAVVHSRGTPFLEIVANKQNYFLTLDDFPRAEIRLINAKDALASGMIYAHQISEMPPPGPPPVLREPRDTFVSSLIANLEEIRAASNIEFGEDGQG